MALLSHPLRSTILSLIFSTTGVKDDGERSQCCWPGPGRGQPARRGLCERQASSRDHTPQDSGAVELGSASLRHQQAAEGITWLCVQNPGQVSASELGDAAYG